MNTREWLQALDKGFLPIMDPNEKTRNLWNLRKLGLIDQDNALTPRGREVLAIWTKEAPDAQPSSPGPTHTEQESE